VSGDHVLVMQEGLINSKGGLWNLTFPSARLRVARWLIAFSFVWPFFNFAGIFPEMSLEVNFVFVFLAAGLLPEDTFCEKWSLLLALPAFAVAIIWANPTAPLRLAIGIIPLHFVFNLTRRLRERGQDLLPPDLAYRSLIGFVLFCVVQTVHLRLVPIIPGWLIQALVAMVPRYMEVPYDDTGIRGVQGWASEPAGAAMTCIAFSIVAIYQRPERRWRVLSLFALLVLLNKSIYALVLMTLLALSCLFSIRRKLFALLALGLFSLIALFYIAGSGRIADLDTSLLINGISNESNRDLQRFAQIFGPLEQFPHIYKPPTLYANSVMEPVGLLPLVVGYGGLIGLAWLVYFLVQKMRSCENSVRPLALTAGFVLLMMTPPDLIPSVVALAVCLAPRAALNLPELRYKMPAAGTQFL
jgi:hypothetical protein